MMKYRFMKVTHAFPSNKMIPTMREEYANPEGKLKIPPPTTLQIVLMIVDEVDEPVSKGSCFSPGAAEKVVLTIDDGLPSLLSMGFLSISAISEYGVGDSLSTAFPLLFGVELISTIERLFSYSIFFFFNFNFNLLF